MPNNPLTVEKIEQLSRQIKLLDTYQSPRHKVGYMSLELGKRSGLTSGYPVLEFSHYKGIFSITTKIPYDSDNDQYRDTTPEEMITFVLIAKNVYPEERMTKELERYVRQKINPKYKIYSLKLKR